MSMLSGLQHTPSLRAPTSSTTPRVLRTRSRKAREASRGIP